MNPKGYAFWIIILAIGLTLGAILYIQERWSRRKLVMHYEKLR